MSKPIDLKSLLLGAILGAALLILGGGLMLAALAWGNRPPQAVQAEWQEEGNGRYVITEGASRIFKFDGLGGNRVFVPDAPAFDFGANQDFSVEAWIKAYPSSSDLACALNRWLQAHSAALRFTPRPIAAWINAHSAENAFGVTPIVDKHQTPSTVEAVGFQLYLDHGRLACQLAEPPMRPLGFQNFVSPGPDLQDGQWHHVAMTVERSRPGGGKLYVDGRAALVFDPTRQSGDLSNSEPVRIGNHADPNLRCFFKGLIGNVALCRRALSAEEVAASFRAGRPKR
jgi:Concanavalin A-like lectin/glucanases superfamily